MAHAGGRPTKYEGEKTIEKVKAYLDSCVDTERTRDEEGNIVRASVKLPSIEGLAVYIKITRETIYQWMEEYQEFSDIIKELQAKQAEKLMNNGLAGKYNFVIAKVLLTKHGYREGSDVTSDGKQIKGNSITFENFKNEAEG